MVLIFMYQLLVVPALPSKSWMLDVHNNNEISIMISINRSHRSNRLCRAYFPFIQCCLSSGGTGMIWNDFGCEIFSSAKSLLLKS